MFPLYKLWGMVLMDSNLDSTLVSGVLFPSLFGRLYFGEMLKGYVHRLNDADSSRVGESLDSRRV